MSLLSKDKKISIWTFIYLKFFFFFATAATYEKKKERSAVEKKSNRAPLVARVRTHKCQAKAPAWTSITINFSLSLFFFLYSPASMGCLSLFQRLVKSFVFTPLSFFFLLLKLALMICLCWCTRQTNGSFANERASDN